MKCVGVTPIFLYLFDHGWDGIGENDTQVDKGGIQLGGTDPNHTDNWYTVAGPTKDYPNDSSLKEFAQDLGKFTNVGTTINIRSCYGGLFAQEVAQWSGRTTTGWTGKVVKSAPSGDRTAGYVGYDNYVEYNDDGTLSSSELAYYYYGNAGPGPWRILPNGGH